MDQQRGVKNKSTLFLKKTHDQCHRNWGTKGVGHIGKEQASIKDRFRVWSQLR